MGYQPRYGWFNPPCDFSILSCVFWREESSLNPLRENSPDSKKNWTLFVRYELIKLAFTAFRYLISYVFLIGKIHNFIIFSKMKVLSLQFDRKDFKGFITLQHWWILDSTWLVTKWSLSTVAVLIILVTNLNLLTTNVPIM